MTCCLRTNRCELARNRSGRHRTRRDSDSIFKQPRSPMSSPGLNCRASRATTSSRSRAVARRLEGSAASKTADTSPRSRGMTCPRCWKQTTLENKEGAGNAGCALHPRPRVQQKSTRVSNHRYTASTGIPCTMVLTVSFVLFPVTGLFCHRRSADRIRRP